MKYLLLAPILLIAPMVARGATDASGNTWDVSNTGCIQENGQDIAGGCQSSDVKVSDGVVWGKDNGNGPICPGCWFTLSSGIWTKKPTQVPTPSDPVIPTRFTPDQPDVQLHYACSEVAPNSDPAHGGFSAINGSIYTPDGKPFVGAGINIRNDQLTDAVNSGRLLADFPGLNMIRLYFEGSFSDDMTAYKPAIDALTAKGVVVVIEDHTGISQAPYTGAQLAAEQAWYANLASTYKTNPYVWFGTFNEPGNGTNLPGIGAQEQATYNTIRGAGSTSPILMEEPSGGNPGLVGANAHGYDGSGPMTSGADYSKMENIVWDLHYYGWGAKYSADQSAVDAGLQGSANGAVGLSGAATIASSGGNKVPIIIGEFGNSTDGNTIDPNADQVITAVSKSGHGFLAWAWNPGPADVLTDGSGNLTNYGRQIATAIKTAGSGASGCNTSSIPTIVPQKPADGNGLIPQKSLAGIQPPLGMGSR